MEEKIIRNEEKGNQSATRNNILQSNAEHTHIHMKRPLPGERERIRGKEREKITPIRFK